MQDRSEPLIYVFVRQVDWDRYVDEDEEEENQGFDMKDLEGGMVCTQYRAPNRVGTAAHVGPWGASGRLTCMTCV